MTTRPRTTADSRNVRVVSHRTAPKLSDRQDDGHQPPPTSESGSTWLSIKKACQVLGVDQSTLRRWSDSGRVPVFRTPGGHRRYAEEDIQALVAERHRKSGRSRVNRQALTNRSLSAYEPEYVRGARERPWFKAYSAQTLEEHRRLGRRLVDLAIRFAAAAPTASDRGSLLADAEQIGHHYGRFGAEAGLSVGETVEAFLYFRLPVVQSIIGLVDDEGLAARRAARIFVDVGHLLDQVLIVMIRAHEELLAVRGASQSRAYA